MSERFIELLRRGRAVLNPTFFAPRLQTCVALQPSNKSLGLQLDGPMMLIDAVLQQSRLDALAACDANVTSYDPSSFLVIFRCRGRQMPFIIKPLLCLMAWGVAWALIFARFEHVRLAMLPLNDLITPLLTPVSFLLVFRLGRAAVCYWDASPVRIG